MTNNIAMQSALRQGALGPGDFQSSNPNQPSLLNSTAWQQLQVYVQNGLNLPTTLTALQTLLGPGAPAGETFSDLLTAYGNIVQHCHDWQTNGLPPIVSLATSLENYANHTVQTYYSQITAQAAALQANPNDTNAQQTLQGVLTVLQTDVQNFADSAKPCMTSLQNFAIQCGQDRSVICGQDGQSALVKIYNDKYAAAGSDVASLQAQIKAQQDIYAARDADYQYDTVVAATTPTYAWLFPFGTLAAVGTAAAFTTYAVEALAARNAAQAKINAFSAQIASDANLILTLNIINRSLNNVSQTITNAIGVLGSFQSSWSKLAGDFASLKSAISNDFTQISSLMASLGIQDLKQQWSGVAQVADNFVNNAFITVLPSQPAGRRGGDGNDVIGGGD